MQKPLRAAGEQSAPQEPPGRVGVITRGSQSSHNAIITVTTLVMITTATVVIIIIIVIISALPRLSQTDSCSGATAFSSGFPDYMRAGHRSHRPRKRLSRGYTAAACISRQQCHGLPIYIYPAVY